jgi:hypothetical protein
MTVKMVGQINRDRHGWMDGWMGGWVGDGWMDGWVDR